MSRLISIASFIAAVKAHGYVQNIVVNGVYYSGWEINSYPYMTDPPVVAAWQIPNSNGPVDVSNGYTTEDIICNLNATNAQGYVEVAAGDKINLQWSAWPDSHHGPVIDYLASCGDDCTTVDKTTLEFFKIDGVGLVDDATVPGTWGDDELIDNNNSWLVEIPTSIAPGNYVLRHEIIALHSAGESGGAQNYPQCFNLKVTGSGTDSPAGTLGTELYNLDDAGILVNIYQSLSTYEIPGPTLYSGATSIAQATSKITATGSATSGAGGAAATGSGAASSAATTTTTTAAAATSTTTITAAAETAKSSVASAPSASAPAAAAPTTVSVPTTLSTATRTTLATTTTAVAVQPSVPAVQPSASAPASGSGSGSGSNALYAQCGGLNFKGATGCVSGATCKQMNPYYSQCVAA
ncbi:glycosyl hydrolase family 61-domain-containing protein [Aspergillus multicolor]|uniref:glycosyl hydrolase family 61-domain-containing protein n=1 Tax=Aspergillus multicolor TaxID=41759 RepID=UPI003CCD6E13